MGQTTPWAVVPQNGPGGVWLGEAAGNRKGPRRQKRHGGGWTQKFPIDYQGRWRKGWGARDDQTRNLEGLGGFDSHGVTVRGKHTNDIGVKSKGGRTMAGLEQESTLNGTRKKISRGGMCWDLGRHEGDSRTAKGREWGPRSDGIFKKAPDLRVLGGCYQL